MKMNNLVELLLYNNEFTGTIPTELGLLNYLESFALSYNSLKGGIPSEIGNLKNLSLLHLQGNMLTGNTEWMTNCMIWGEDRSFVADCGIPSGVSDPLKCKCCNICCNVYERCQTSSSEEMTPGAFAAVSLGSFAGFVLLFGFVTMCIIARHKLKSVFGDLDVYTLSGTDSVYSLILGKGWIGVIITVITVVIQCLLFAGFLQAAYFGYDNSDWVYTIRCPSNRLECDDERGLSTYAWAISGVFIMISLLPDLLNGLKLIGKAALFHSFRCFTIGIVLVFVTTLAIVTSFFYNYAIAQSDTEMIINAAVLLFVNDVDERVLLVLENVCFAWLKDRKEEAKEYSEQLLHGVVRQNVVQSYRVSYNDPVIAHLMRRIVELEEICVTSSVTDSADTGSDDSECFKSTVSHLNGSESQSEHGKCAESLS
eukprot:CAMPEP_0172484624 /NCGR_PEP_ID=MMETSP1066-20121228/12162_1 /TAXON_ID=671091 /ORGANISM="Coscinodiscus wailesii, Strain CCMP2513" /LENGTH=424 /DNA_ID=CAMNT_0013249271 /DNA_START=105 /DNA_END=1379 /DNA_ORIENTATION=-